MKKPGAWGLPCARSVYFWGLNALQDHVQQLVGGLRAGLARTGDADVPGRQGIPDLQLPQPARGDGAAGVIVIDAADAHAQRGETDDAVRRLKRDTGLPVIRAFRIDSPEDVNRALNSSADLILLDSGAGGTGSAFDWKLIRSISRKFVLAGGLGPENVREAIALTSPFAVDASSGLETEGRKDPDKIRRFVQTIRRIESGCTERK